MPHQSVINDCAPEEECHQGDRSRCSVDGKEANETDFREIDACHELLEDFVVCCTFGVDIISQDIQGVVAGCDVDNEEANRGES
jgi:hypothetical protein